MTKLLMYSIFLLGYLTAFSQDYTWETGVDNGATVTETVSGVTATVTTTNNDANLVDGGGFKGSSGNITFTHVQDASTSLTITFSSPRDVLSVFTFFSDAESGPDVDMVFTPTGGSNSVVTEGIPEATGEVVTLNWTDVTVITISRDDGGVETIGIDDIAIGVLMPVELLAFDVELKDDNAHLSWQTASEINNKGFEVEHSEDGNIWRNIGFVNGEVNSDRLNDYQFIHESSTIGLNYYRLKQLDLDGVYTYSDIKAIEVLRYDSQWSVYPNPVKGESFSLSISDPNFDFGKLLIFNSIGALVQSQEIVDLQSDIQISTLPKGVYFLALEANGQRSMERLVIQ